jgi:hypothetical protein
LIARNPGLLARLGAGLRAALGAMEYSGLDYAPDRIGGAEQEFARLKALLERAGIDVESSNETPNRYRAEAVEDVS